jgi:BolA protein
MNQARPFSVAELEAQLVAKLHPGWLEVLDESAGHAGHAGANAQGSGSHFRIRIASPAFTGKSRIERHRLVYDSLQNFIDEGLHALAIETIEAPASVNQSTGLS